MDDEKKVRKEDQYFDLGGSPVKYTIGNPFPFVKNLKKENLPLFFKPLFDRLPKKEVSYWMVFAVIGLFSTGMILRFINTYIAEQENYQDSLTSIGRYNAIYRELESENATSSKPADVRRHPVIY